MKQASISTYNFKDTDMLFKGASAPSYISGKSSKSSAKGSGTAETESSEVSGVSKNRHYRTYDFPLKLRDLPEDDKPREKLLDQGAQALSLQELIAVVLQVGTKSEDILSISSRIIREYGPSALTSVADPKQMADTLQIPVGKACQIVACTEIGKRLYKKNEFGLTVIRSAEDVFNYLKDMHNLPKEQLRGIYLDTHNRVIHDEVISIGTLNSNIVHPREVFRPALEYGAAAVVLAHNHPSGIETPSTSDIQITEQLIEAGKIIGIRILDHIIITKNGYQSVDVQYE